MQKYLGQVLPGGREEEEMKRKGALEGEGEMEEEWREEKGTEEERRREEVEGRREGSNKSQCLKGVIHIQ